MKYFLRLLSLGIVLLPMLLWGQDSRIELHTFQSAALGIPKSFNIYLPPDYDQSTERYPVIYLFRGHEREWANPGEDNSRQGRTVKDDADAVINAGAMGHVILVMPGMSSSDNAVPTCAVNMLAPSLAVTRDGIGTGKFEDYLVTELIPYIDRTYRTIPSRWYRAVDGFSLGGYTSMMLATKHPELFTSAGAFDGTLMWLNFTNPSRPDTLNDLWVTNSMFDPMFNLPRNLGYMTAYNEANLVRDASGATVHALRQMQFLLHATPAGNNDRTEHFISLLGEKGIANGFSVVNLTPTAQHNWYYADMHAMQTFPKHWQKFQSPSPSLSSPLSSPAAQATVSGIVPLAWKRGTADSAVTLLMVSRDGGGVWQTLLMSAASDSSFAWDTRLTADGTRYMLRLLVIARDSSLGYSESAGAFTVNNPGNAAPDLEITAPAGGDTVSNDTEIKWIAGDADGDPVSVSVEFSADNGASWKSLASSAANSGALVWKTSQEPNTRTGLIRIRATDGTLTTERISHSFSILNARHPIPNAHFLHRGGSGDGSLAVVSVGEAPPPSYAYNITFNDSGTSGTTYSVTDPSRGNLVTNAKVVNGLEGPLFDGMRLIIYDYTVPQPGVDSIRWTKGASTLEASVSLPDVNIGSEVLRGVPYPADYVITIADHVADTSSTFLDSAPMPMKFSVWNRTEGRKAEVIYNDNDYDAALSRNDELYIIEKNAAGAKELTWQIVFPANLTYAAPVPGDQFLIKIMKPFTSRDFFVFRPIVDAVGERAGSAPGRWALEQNFPNPFNPSTQIRFSVGRTQMVTLVVYDILGRAVATLVHAVMKPGAYTATWNASSMPSGMYFYRIDAGEFSQTKKLVLVR
jgi:S-formylglutathione hydrolase FrmB